MKKWIKENIYYVLVVLAIVAPWFFKSGYLFFMDFYFGPNVSIDFFSNGFLITFLIKVFSLLYFYGFGQKIFFGGVLLVVLLGGKKLLENFIHNKWLVFLSSLFFLFNPFVYDRIMYGQIGVVAAFGFLCLAFGYLLEYLKKGEKKQIYLAGIFTGLAIQLSSHFIFFFSLVYVIFILTSVIEKKKFKEIVKITLVISIFIMVLNINWLVGSFLKPSGSLHFLNEVVQTRDLVVFQTSGNTGTDALRNVVMMSGFWGKDQLRYLDLTLQKENWGRSFWFLLPLIIWGIITGVKRKEFRNVTVGLLVVFGIAIMLAVGVRLPICKEITYWLFHNVLFYRALRESQKWVALVVMVYGIFLALGLEKLFSKDIVRNNRILSAIILGIVIIMQAPLLLFGLGGQIMPVDYPKDWSEINNYIIANQKPSAENQSPKCKDTILFLPWHMYMGFGWIGRVVANPANLFFVCPVIVGTNMEWGGIYDNSLDPIGQKVEGWLNGNKDVTLLHNLDIKYIILAKEIDWQKYAWLDGLSGVKVEKETDTLKLYKINQ